jgi:hypothetical protein
MPGGYDCWLPVRSVVLALAGGRGRSIRGMARSGRHGRSVRPESPLCVSVPSISRTRYCLELGYDIVSASVGLRGTSFRRPSAWIIWRPAADPSLVVSSSGVRFLAFLPLAPHMRFFRNVFNM